MLSWFFIVLAHWNVSPLKCIIQSLYFLSNTDSRHNITEKLLSLATITNSLYKIVAPKTPPVDAVIESTSAPATTQTTIKLKFELSWFLNTDNGVRTDGGVMVCQASKCTGYRKLVDSLLELVHCTWGQIFTEFLISWLDATHAIDETWYTTNKNAKFNTYLLGYSIG
jgi:hypothetical protein